jgi:hypothetical protein
VISYWRMLPVGLRHLLEMAFGKCNDQRRDFYQFYFSLLYSALTGND